MKTLFRTLSCFYLVCVWIWLCASSVQALTLASEGGDSGIHRNIEMFLTIEGMDETDFIPDEIQVISDDFIDFTFNLPSLDGMSWLSSVDYAVTSPRTGFVRVLYTSTNEWWVLGHITVSPLYGPMAGYEEDFDLYYDDMEVDSPLFQFWDAGGTPVTDVIYGTYGYHWVVQTDPVPEPATIFLLASGFAGFASFRRKNKKS